MKHILASLLFLVSWQEYELRQSYITHRLADNLGQFIFNDEKACGSGAVVIYLKDGIYCQKFIDEWKVEIVDHSIKLATHKDATLWLDKLLKENAMKIKVTEEK